MRFSLLVLCLFLCVSRFPAQEKSELPVGVAKTAGQESPCGPPEYCARTDRRIEPYSPEARAIGRAGSIFEDPAFGSRILRLTDWHTLRERPGISFHTPSSAEQNTWNIDGTKFYVNATGGSTLVFDFDPAKMKPRYSGIDLAGRPFSWRSEPEFSFVSPNIIYGITGDRPPKFQQYNLSTKRAVDVHDPAICIKLQSNEFGLDLSVSGDDNRLLGVFGPGQDRDEWIYIYDKHLGCRWYNTATGEVGGNWGPTGTISLGDRFLVHNARLSKSGEYAAIVGDGSGIVLWQVATLNATICSHNQPNWCGGHWIMGYSHLVNSPGVRDTMNLLIRPLNDPGSATPLITDLPTPTEWFGKHLSWNNANRDDTTPVCLSTFRDDNPSAPGAPLKVGRAWDNEILCVRTDAKSSVVWRFAHTFSSATSGFWATPRGNVSQDGRFYMFTSDWENTLGLSPQAGGQRTDVFVVELK